MLRSGLFVWGCCIMWANLVKGCCSDMGQVWTKPLVAGNLIQPKENESAFGRCMFWRHHNEKTLVSGRDHGFVVGCLQRR